MSQEQLWAPWRLSYITGPKDEEKPSEPGCFICRYRGQPELDASNFVAFRGASSLVILNRYPYNNGHLLVAPVEHKADLCDLSADESGELQRLLQHFVAALRRIMQPQGFNIGINLGHIAGAGLPGHLHWHIVPRWSGDTGYMSACADVRVIPQSLAALYDLLKQDLAEHPCG